MRLSLTGRISWQKTLSLRPFDLDKDRGDVLWVPKAQQDVIKNIVSGS